MDKVTNHGLASGSDPSLEKFAEGVKLLGEKNYPGAASLFEKVVAETDGRHLKDRSRQYLAICHRQEEAAEVFDDPYLAAVYHKNQGDLEGALGYCEGQSGEKFAYLTSSIKALLGQEEEAIADLEKAISLEPKNRIHAFHDPDFDGLRGTEEFMALINPPTPNAEAS